MTETRILTPAAGSRFVEYSNGSILFGQPPDILKGLLRQGIVKFDTLVLPDIRERDGSLLNNVEFPLYSFLFLSQGLAEKRKLNLVGDADAISQTLRLLRITLVGPTEQELGLWQTDPELQREWLAVSHELALKNQNSEVIPVDEFFNLVPYKNNRAHIDGLIIHRTAADQYTLTDEHLNLNVDLNEDTQITPPYPVVSDYVPGRLNKFGIEVLGGASGFSVDEPCTGLALCFNGNYLLIDSVPFLNQHLFARGISKNQVTAIFLTHLHDDHCSMFPLLEMPHRVEIITTRQIYQMAMEKLACNLGWKPRVIEEFFTLIEVNPGETLNYFGLNIEVHNTVHSVPTIGATFSTVHKGKNRDVCVVGDNQNMSKIIEMGQAGIVRQSTIDNLQRLYHQRFHLLIADGGAGEIHGDPNDALESESDRVVFVHVDDVPDTLKTTFSVVSSGKRYTLFDDDDSIYSTRIHHHLTDWLGSPLPDRWLGNLLVEQEIYHYNAEDVIIVQGSSTSDFVYLILTGYCDVVRVDDGQRQTVASLQAGDVIGEMAVLTGSGVRNASVVASTPVTVCVFEEEAFRNFILYSGLQNTLENRWFLRPKIKALPQFSLLTSTIIDRLVQHARWHGIAAGDSLTPASGHYYLFADGNARYSNGSSVNIGDEFGVTPFERINTRINADTDCGLIEFDHEMIEHLRRSIPQLNYQLRKRCLTHCNKSPDWLLGKVSIYQPLSENSEQDDLPADKNVRLISF